MSIARGVVFLFLASFVGCGASASDRAGVTIERLAALHEIGGLLTPNVSPSPNGDEIALFERSPGAGLNDYRHTLIVVDARTGRMRTLADAGGIILESTNGRRSGAPLDRRAYWSSDGRWIYFLASREGRSEIWRVRASGGDAEPIVQGDADVSRFRLQNQALIYELLSPRPILAAQRWDTEAHGFRVDRSFSPVYGLRPIPNEQAGARVLTLDIALRAITTARASDLEEASDPTAPSIRALDPSLDVRSPPLGLYTSAASDAARCTDEACSGALIAAWRNGAGGEIIFLRLEGHARAQSALYAWRPGSPVRALRRRHDKLEGCALASSALICLHQTPTQPRRLVRIDLRDGATTLLYDPNPAWSEYAMPRVERIEFTDDDGAASFAHLVYPLHYRPGRRYPIVVVQYRWRGLLRAGTGDETPIFPLSARGYVVLSVDRPEFEARAQRATLDTLQRDIELDGSEHAAKRIAVRHFIDAAVARGIGDASRIGLTGMSDGAETVFDMVTQADYAAAVASSPPLDEIAWSLNSANFRANRSERLGITPPWSTASSAWAGWWRQRSVSTHAERIRTPLLLNLSESEAMRAFPFIARMEETTTPMETYIYPGAYHLKWRPSQIMSAQQRTVAWLDFWLYDRDPPSEQDGQRWRAMRNARVGD